MSRKLLLSVSVLGLTVASLMWALPQVGAQVFVGTPIMIKGVLYTTAGTRRSVVALDAKTGELIWSHSLREGQRAANAARQLSGRGVSYWTDGRGDERIIYVTTGFRLVELNAKTGAVITSFADNGLVDLKVGATYGNDQQIDLETGEI